MKRWGRRKSDRELMLRIALGVVGGMGIAACFAVMHRLEIMEIGNIWDVFKRLTF